VGVVYQLVICMVGKSGSAAFYNSVQCRTVSNAFEKSNEMTVREVGL